MSFALMKDGACRSLQSDAIMKASSHFSRFTLFLHSTCHPAGVSPVSPTLPPRPLANHYKTTRCSAGVL